MKALSAKAPWAQFIIYGIPLLEKVPIEGELYRLKLSGKRVLKDIENRGWALPAWFKVPQRVYVHVGQREDNDIEGILDLTVKKIGLPFMMVMSMMSPMLGRGAVIGTIEITGCVTESESPWFVGPNGLVLRNPIALKHPVPCPGRLGFFELPPEVVAEIERLNGRPEAVRP